MADIVGAGDRWIPQHEYDLIQARVPIVCVDLAPLSAEPPQRVGLIMRDTYDGEKGWCLVGGAVLRDEKLTDAVLRHVRATLGDGMAVDTRSLALQEVVEYFTSPTMGEFHDPRKHAVALNYSGVCHGHAAPQGEALDFRWFRREELADIPFGFGQGKALRRVLRRLDRN